MTFWTFLKTTETGESFPSGRKMPIAVFVEYDRGAGRMLSSGEFTVKTDNAVIKMADGVLQAAAAGDPVGNEIW